MNLIGVIYFLLSRQYMKAYNRRVTLEIMSAQTLLLESDNYSNMNIFFY